jgi:bifunctional DNA-binding transcriptional regulator/antitoxin component of YhaV-PrlF toxin-antitoxin module
MTDHKKYSLGQVENFLHDAMSSGATPQEIYDTIRGVVEDNYYTYKKCASEAYELLALLNGNGEGHISSVISRGNKIHQEIDDCMPPWGDSDATSQRNQIHQEIEDILVGIRDDCRIPCDMEALKYTDEELDAMCDAAEAKDKVNKWILPVDDDYNITFPEDLLEQTGWKEGDVLEWIDQGDGSFKMIKLEKKEHPSWVRGNELSKVKTYQEMIDDGWSMTDDGFWIKEN